MVWQRRSRSILTILLMDRSCIGECRCIVTGHMSHTQGSLRVNLLTEDLSLLPSDIVFVDFLLMPKHLVVAFLALDGGVESSCAQKLLLH